jgi:hypothetical protein
VLSRTPLPDAAPIIAAGIGAADVSVIASRLGRRVVAFSDLANAAPGIELWATACAPAVSVALLMN